MITKELISEYFEYRDGRLYWKKVAHTSKEHLIGKEAGSVHKTGYRYVTWLGKSHKVHRLIFMLEYGYLPPEIDHINNDRQDNRLENLRAATRSQNQCNRFALSSNTSGFAGVTWHKHAKSWYVRLMINGKTKIIGYYKDLELAGLVSQEARVLYHGKFAKQF